jgi:hypothetical protein
MKCTQTGAGMSKAGALRGRPRGLDGYARTLVAAAHVWLIVLRIHAARTFARFAPFRSPGSIAEKDSAMGITDQICQEILSWPGVTEEPHRFGGIEFRLGKRELGHLHGDYLADLPFPVRVREELVAAGKAMPHHILPASGWVSYPIRDATAVPGALALFRLAYDRATAKRGPAPDDDGAAHASDGPGA